MRNKGSVRRTVLVYLLLHTSVVVVLALLLTRGGIPYNPLFAAVMLAGIGALVLTTARMITGSVSEEIARSEKGMAGMLANLQTTLGVMGTYTRELERRTEMLGECKRELERRAGMIAEYSDRINELVSAAESLNAADAGTGESVPNQKTG